MFARSFRNSHENPCLPTLIDFDLCLTRSMQGKSKQLSYKLLSINFHPCLTGSKESQNNFHTNSCPPTFIHSHPCLTRCKEGHNNFHTNSCLSTLINSLSPTFANSHQLSSLFDQEQGKSKQLLYKLLSANFHQLSSINFHLCLTRSKESQNNSHTNSCLNQLSSTLNL